MLPNTSRLRILYLAYLSKPAQDRPIYREIIRHSPRRILELGFGVGQRAVRMIELAGHFQPHRQIQYTAVDLFESRSAADGPGVTLKMAHRLLKSTGARVQLVPGDPETALSQIANSLGQVDMVVVSRRLDRHCLARAWFYVPRLLHERSRVLLEEPLHGGRTSVRLPGRSEIESLAAASRRRAA